MDKACNQDHNASLFDHGNVVNTSVVLNCIKYPPLNANAKYDGIYMELLWICNSSSGIQIICINVLKQSELWISLWKCSFPRMLQRIQKLVLSL